MCLCQYLLCLKGVNTINVHKYCRQNIYNTAENSPLCNIIIIYNYLLPLYPCFLFLLYLFFLLFNFNGYLFNSYKCTYATSYKAQISTYTQREYSQQQVQFRCIWKAAQTKCNNNNKWKSKEHTEEEHGREKWKIRGKFSTLALALDCTIHLLNINTLFLYRYSTYCNSKYK